MRIILSMALAIFLTAGSVAVFAADGNEPAPRHTRHKPPQAAFDACKNLTENASCQLTGRNNDVIEGVCNLPPEASDDNTLACRPNRPSGERSQRAE